LGKLKDLGLIFSQREGKEIWYEAADGRVRYERHTTETTLKITARTTGMAVTIAIPIQQEVRTAVQRAGKVPAPT
jgi:hypothetical protein